MSTRLLEEFENHIEELKQLDEKIQRRVEKLEHQCHREAKEFAHKVQDLQRSNQVCFMFIKIAVFTFCVAISLLFLKGSLLLLLLLSLYSFYLLENIDFEKPYDSRGQSQVIFTRQLGYILTTFYIQSNKSQLHCETIRCKKHVAVLWQSGRDFAAPR